MVDAYRSESARCARCATYLPPEAAFCPECGLAHRSAERPARILPAGGRGRRNAWLPALVVAVVVTAIGVGAGFALLIGSPSGPELGAGSTASASPSESAAPATPEPSTSVSPTDSPPSVTPQPTAPPNAALANRSIANVEADHLNVRAAASDSAEVLGQLRAGARVFTIGAPENVGDTYWYRVAVVSGVYSGGECATWEEFCTAGIGWVASPTSGDPWLEEVEIGCPSSPMTAQDLVRLVPLERLRCYGNEDIVVTGTIDTPCCGHVGPIRYEPAWLSVPGSAAYFRDLNRALLFRADPASGLAPPERGDVIRATAHFDDPASPSCRQSLDPAAGEVDPSYGPAPAAVAVLMCRAQLVVSSYEVTDRIDLGPCCGLLPNGATSGVPARQQSTTGRGW